MSTEFSDMNDIDHDDDSGGKCPKTVCELMYLKMG